MANVDVYAHSNIQGLLNNIGGQHVYTYRHNANDALSVTMPIRNESYRYDGLHPIFQMNLPEGVLREAIARATAKQYGSDDLTLLTLLGNRQIGRLAYAREGQPYQNSIETTPSLKDLLGSDDANLFSQLLANYATQSGVAGVQPKVLMDMPDVSGKATLPLHAYIVKSWGQEYPELGCNEFFCLTFAQASGLNVVDFSLSDNGKLLVTRRFDVIKNDVTGEQQILGFEDFCVLQGRGTREKYDASIESCANTFGQYVAAPYKKQALYDFFKLTLVNIFIRNGDAHLKNIGILYSDLNEYRLGTPPTFTCKMAPIFDIVSTVPYLPNDTMALSLTGSKRWPKWSVLQVFAKQHCGLNNQDIERCVAEIEIAINQTLPVLNSLAKQHIDFGPVAEVIFKLLNQRDF